MKTNNFILLSFLFFNFNSFAGEVFLKVEEIEDKVGFIHVALYDKPENFPKKNGKLVGLKIEVSKMIKEGVTIKNLKQSNYAIAIFHDKNSNNKFDKFLSIPNEKYGFSNNAPVFFGPPKFEEAAFFLSSNERLELEIKLR